MYPILIEVKLLILLNQLRHFKTAFSDLERITLIAKINQNDQSQFRDHSQLVDHFREQMLPICDSSPFYTFAIEFQSDKDGAGNFISEILQLPSINRGREVYFHYYNETFIQLPVGVISNWLNRNSEIDNTGSGQSKQDRYLGMNNRIRIQNAEEMCDRLKMVSAFYLFIKILKKLIL